ncbi:unnamed protein product [Parascedosporium putredinis]|uniref:Uncharacterized protein n=1 Tax=Parascedosporium putredinis TaxID=1442378 RepID=A0A9P1H2V9_9PEZI|nr:unnamed protein product [Parascedosporium putredinis]CAI7993964.1 unnamed protein product [Parascedosporium putredinis]
MAATKGNSGHVPMVDTYADEAPPSYDASHPDANRSAASGSTAPTTNSQPRTHHMNTAAQPQRISRPSGRTLPSGYVEIPEPAQTPPLTRKGTAPPKT